MLSNHWLQDNNLCKVIILFLAKLYLTSVKGESLHTTYSSVRLPLKDHSSRVWYDGQDSIYLFGTSDYYGKIVKYSLSQDTVYSIDSLPVTVGYGSVQSDSDGNLFYFGAEIYENDKVLKFSKSSNSTSIIARLPYDIFGIPTIPLDNKTVLILGQWCQWASQRGCVNEGLNIISFDLTTGSYTTLEANLPVSLRYGAAIRFGPDKVYLFPVLGSDIFKSEEGFMWEIGLETITAQKVPGIVLPGFNRYPTVVTDGNFIYLLGGFEPSERFPDWKGFFKIDPVARTVELIHVDNWPIYEQPPPCVYVGKLGRIYCFGGHKRDSDGVYISDHRGDNDIFFFVAGSDGIRHPITDGVTKANGSYLTVLLFLSEIFLILATGRGMIS